MGLRNKLGTLAGVVRERTMIIMIIISLHQGSCMSSYKSTNSNACNSARWRDDRKNAGSSHTAMKINVICQPQ